MPSTRTTSTLLTFSIAAAQTISSCNGQSCRMLLSGRAWTCRGLGRQHGCCSRIRCHTYSDKSSNIFLISLQCLLAEHTSILVQSLQLFNSSSTLNSKDSLKWQLLSGANFLAVWPKLLTFRTPKSVEGLHERTEYVPQLWN